MIRPLFIVIQEYNKIMYNISNYRKIEKVTIQKIDMYRKTLQHWNDFNFY
jgi:hypothetical protein